MQLLKDALDTIDNIAAIKEFFRDNCKRYATAEIAAIVFRDFGQSKIEFRDY